MYRPLTQAVLVQNSMEKFAQELKLQIELWKKEEAAPSASTAIAQIAARLENRVKTDRQLDSEEAWQDVVIEAVRQLRAL